MMVGVGSIITQVCFTEHLSLQLSCYIWNLHKVVLKWTLRIRLSIWEKDLNKFLSIDFMRKTHTLLIFKIKKRKTHTFLVVLPLAFAFRFHVSFSNLWAKTIVLRMFLAIAWGYSCYALVVDSKILRWIDLCEWRKSISLFLVQNLLISSNWVGELMWLFCCLWSLPFSINSIHLLHFPRCSFFRYSTH